MTTATASKTGYFIELAPELTNGLNKIIHYGFIISAPGERVHLNYLALSTLDIEEGTNFYG
jgi:hypothetical protein